MSEGQLIFFIAAILSSSAFFNWVRESLSAFVVLSVYSCASFRISSFRSLVFFETSFATKVAMPLSVFEFYGVFLIASTVFASAASTSIKPNFFSVFSFGLRASSELLGWG